MHRNPLFITLILIALLVSTTSCRKADVSDIKAQGVLPDIVMEDATYVFGRPDNSPLVITAGKITVYNSTSEVIFENLSFTREDGKISGSCLEGHSYDEQEIHLAGSVEIFNSEDDAKISAADVIWNDTDKTIVSDSEVSVVFEGQNKVTGVGFSANINRNTYEFDQIIEGRFEDE